MERNIFEGSPEYSEALKLAKEAKAERDKANAILKGAEKIEQQAVVKFRSLRTAKLEELQKQEKELREQYSEMEKEYKKMFHQLCEVRGSHEYKHWSEIISYREIGHSFSRGSIYPTEQRYICKICGSGNASLRFRPYRSKYHSDMYSISKEEKNNIISELANGKEGEKPEVQELAQKILSYPDEMQKVQDLIKQNQEDIEMLCQLFGHDGELVSYDREIYKCKCCGKTLSYQEYINAHYAAAFRGGIVDYNYTDEGSIL